MAHPTQALTLAASALLVMLAGCSQPAQNTNEADDEAATADSNQAYPVTLVPPAAESRTEIRPPAKPARQADRPPPVTYPAAVQPEVMAVRERRMPGISSQTGQLALDRAATSAALQADPGASMERQRMPNRYATPHPNRSQPANRENYAQFVDNPLRLVTENPVSTFSIDVDTGSYTNVRRMLMQGRYPPANAVRAEEFINYFDYSDFPQSRVDDAPFLLATEVGPSPWNSHTKLLRVGLRGAGPKDYANQNKNLVFLIDVSGSMRDPQKLPLLKSALKLLTRQLKAQDRISIAVYAGAAGAVLEPTSGSDSHLIFNAIEKLEAGGSTNGGAGIRLAYEMARTAFIDGGINRVIVATDGDFNVGTVDFDSLKALVAAQRESGIALTSLGFGSGNYNDHLMEQLADVGNGNYYYIDNLNEAQKVLVRDLPSTVHTIASDVKIQIEFNPARVAEYRLIGYENRSLKREDFNNDAVDAGEIGASHRVTALYEVTLKGSGGERVDPLRYANTQEAHNTTQEIAFVRLRYKARQAEASQLIEKVVTTADLINELSRTSQSYRFAAAVSAFAQGLRDSKYLNDWTFGQTRQLAGSAKGPDPFGYRGEFIQLVQLADALQPSHQPALGQAAQGH